MRGITDGLLQSVPEAVAWPEVSVSRRITTPSRETARTIGERAADFPLVFGDRALLDRASRSAILLTPEPRDDGRLLHPFLSAVAVVFAWWDRRHVFHGGAFMDRSHRAWGLLGDRGSGKSSILAQLSLAGLDVLSDDLLVLQGRRAFSGPRCIDLREDAAGALEVAANAAPVRAGERRRLALPSAPAEVALHGWILLTWGDTSGLHRLGPGAWLEGIAAHRSTVTTNAPSLLDLAGLQTWELRRTRGWSSFEPAVEGLLELVGR